MIRHVDLEAFENWMNRHLSKNTVINYLGSVRAFQEWNQWVNPSPQQVDDWLSHLVATGVSKRSAARHFSAIKTWFKWMTRKHELENIVAPRGDRKSPEWFTQAEVQMLMENTRHPMFRAAIALQFAAGLRFAELRLLDRDDVDFSEAKLLVPPVKRRGDESPHVTPVDPDVLEMVATYLTTRTDEDPQLFRTPRGRRLDNEGYNKHLKAKCVEVGIRPRTSHAIRHAWAAYLRRQGLGLDDVKDFLRHADVGSTQVYSHIMPEELRKKMPKAFGDD